MKKLGGGNYLIPIPFEEIYTSSFFLCEGTDTIILDSGSSDVDAKRYIIPEISKLGLNVRYLVSSHFHIDHMGGIQALSLEYPDAKMCKMMPTDGKMEALEDGEILLDRYQVIHLPGHSHDSMAILDTRTKTLFTGDCLQQRGIGKYRNNISDVKEYLGSVERVRAMDVQRFAAAHDFDPLGQFANGREEVLAWLDECETAALNPYIA